MSLHKRTATIHVARQTKQYVAGDPVRIVRGPLAGQILTVRESTNDWVMLKEAGSREVMSKGNVEPPQGFSEEELNQAKRTAERLWKTGSLV